MNRSTHHRLVPAIVPVLVLGMVVGIAPAIAEDDAPLDLKKLFEEGIPRSPFIAAVYAYADAMIEHGRDVHGPRTTGLLLSALDRSSLSPLGDRPAAPAGVREETRPGRAGEALTGANPQLDQNILRLLLFLRSLSGNERYERAAHDALRWFLEECPSRETGLLPWGASLSWDARTDEPISGGGAAAPLHELSGPWLLWSTCFALSPDASARAARAILARHAIDAGSGVFRAIAPFEPRGARAIGPTPAGAREEGFLLRTWAEAFAHTGDARFVSAAEAMVERREGLVGDGETGETGDPAASLISLAIDAGGAARRLPEPLRSRLRRLASTLDRAFLAFPHDLPGKRGFCNVAPARGEDASFTPLWDPTRGPTTAALGVLCGSRYQNTGRVEYRDLLVAAADAYLDALPEDDVDAWPLTFGQAIELELAAHRATSRAVYFERAFALGELALERFFAGSPLPRASVRSEHYESTTGAPTLALALAELHLETLDITAVRAPANTADR